MSVAVPVPLISDTSTSMMLQNWRAYLPTVWWKAPAPGARRRVWPWCPRSSPYSRRAPQTATGVARGTLHHGRAWCHRCAAGVHLKTSGAEVQMWCPSVFPWAVLHLWIHWRHSVAPRKAPLSWCLLFRWKIWIGKGKWAVRNCSTRALPASVTGRWSADDLTGIISPGRRGRWVGISIS